MMNFEVDHNYHHINLALNKKKRKKKLLWLEWRKGKKYKYQTKITLSQL